MNITINIKLGGGVGVAEFVAASLEAFGHLVIWYRNDAPQPPVGSITGKVWGYDIGRPFQLVRKATAAEATAQLELYRLRCGLDVSKMAATATPYVAKPNPAGATVIDVQPTLGEPVKNPRLLANAESTRRPVEKRRRKPPSQ